VIQVLQSYEEYQEIALGAAEDFQRHLLKSFYHQI
jgi:hypothetical protein